MPVPDAEPAPRVTAELIAVIVAVSAGAPRVLTIEAGRALPSGPFSSAHRSLQASLRAWVEVQTHHPLGYVEQLYTFADGGRAAAGADGGRAAAGADGGRAAAGDGERVVSISYLGLTRETRGSPGVTWQDWYRYFPWEDRRDPDATLPPGLIAGLQAWAEAAPDAMLRWQRRNRIAINFGVDGQIWNEEFALGRYETLWEAGLVPESGGSAAAGEKMAHDHRRILATAIARLRGKIKYRPVVFELMPPAFTLGQLQAAVEALAGRRLHKQNFRRLVEQQELVEETGGITAETGGRPAKLFRFRREVVDERAAAGTKLPLAR